MFANERKKPIKLKQQEALFNRISKNHKVIPILERDIKHRKAGYRGELNLDYHLSFLPIDTPYTIIRDIHLKNETKTFQIDNYLLCPYYGLIIEVKNLSGTLYINPHTNQFIRIYGQDEKAYQNPILQAQRQQIQLKKWLLQRKFDPFPIEYIVAFHEGNSTFKTDLMDKSVFNRIIYSENVLKKLEFYERVYKDKQLDEKKIRKMTKLIINNNQPSFFPILEAYDISILELIRGVQCPKCQRFGMNRIVASWSCPNCQTTSKTAHQKAIEEFILLNGFITNSLGQYFLMLPSADIAYRLVNELQLPHTGEYKSRKYFLKELVK